MRVPLAIVALVVVVSDCGGPSLDKAGNVHRKTTVVTLANSLDTPNELQAFADEVARRSDGTIRIRFRNSWREGQINYEPALIEDVAAGKADLGWVGSRALDGFDALTAPFAVDSYALEREVLESKIPDAMLPSIERLGVIGLGVLPGPLRYVLGAPRPLLRPADFAGLRIGYQRGPARDTLRALGAKPVAIPGGARWHGIDAIEQQVASINSNGYDRYAKHLTGNVPLWSRPFVVFANPRLPAAQRTLLRDAMRAAIPGALKISRDMERGAMAPLCRRGIDPVQARDDEKAALRNAVEPVLDALRREPEARAALAAIAAMRQRSDPEPGLACHAEKQPAARAIPDGTYTTHVTLADMRATGADRVMGPKGTDDFVHGTFSLVIDGDGYALYITAPGVPRSPVGEGTFSVYRDRFVATGNGGGGDDSIRARFSRDGTALRFHDVKAVEDMVAVFGSHPWRKIGG